MNPSHVFNAANVTGRLNVDWCESHKVETIRTNMVGTLTPADVCCKKGLILITMPLGASSMYMIDRRSLLLNYENVCTLRVKKFLTQIMKGSVLMKD
ncbi:hypothetical protein AHAS_Ahas05G0087900 [Arachis hypogaea]